MSSQLRHVSTIGKEVLISNISSTCSDNMVNFDPLTAEIGSGVWGTPANFIGFRVLAGNNISVDILQPYQYEVAQFV